MKTIHKYPLELRDYQKIKIPVYAEILSVKNVGNANCIYAMVDTEKEDIMELGVYIVGTGHPVPDGAKHYIGTVKDDPYIWHIFTELEPISLEKNKVAFASELEN